MRNAIIVLVSTLLGSACAEPTKDSTSLQHRDVGGNEDPLIHLPGRLGQKYLCTQGAHGTDSHNLRSTEFGLDLDTSNRDDEPVFAPADGILYIHADDPFNGFGVHVHIDLGDGTYISLSHFKTVFANDNQHVAAGQFIGYEGCTGNCTGDHIHFDRHKGNPSQTADFGESVPMYVFAKNATAGEGFGPIHVEDFVCGITGGHYYESALKTMCALPNGTLVKTPDDPKVYRIDNGKKRWTNSEAVFLSYGYDFADVITVPKEVLVHYPTGSNISDLGMVDAVYDPDGRLWLVVGTRQRSDRYRILIPDNGSLSVLASWGLVYYPQDEPEYVDHDHKYFREWPVQDGLATYRDGSLLHTDTNRDFVITDAMAVELDSKNVFALLGFDRMRALEVKHSDLMQNIAIVGDCDNNHACMTLEMATVCDSPEFSFNAPEEENPLEDFFPQNSGELAVLYEAPANTFPQSMELEGHIERNGEIINTLYKATYNSRYLALRDLYPAPGDALRFTIRVETMNSVFYAVQNCEQQGTVMAFFENEEIIVPVYHNHDESCDNGIYILPESTENETVETVGGENGQDQEPETETEQEQEADPEPEQETPSSGSDTPSNNTNATLEVYWVMPNGHDAARISLHGEYMHSDGSYGFLWRFLEEKYGCSTIAYELPNVSSGDTFRFTVEFTDIEGNTSWSCVGPYNEANGQFGTLQGSVFAKVNGDFVEAEKTGDPTGYTDGCSMLVTVP